MGSTIKVQVDLVRSNAGRLGSAAGDVEDCRSNIRSLQQLMDHRILARSNIGGRMSQAAASLNNVDNDIQKLKGFIHQAMDMYAATEKRVAGKANMKFALREVKGSENKKTEENRWKQDPSSILEFIDNLGKYAVTAQGFVGASLVLGKQIHFSAKNGDKKRAVIHSAKWIKGRGNNEFFKKLARRVNKSMYHPGMLMKGIMKVDATLEKVTRAQWLGIHKANNLNHWLKNVVVGVKEHTSGIKTSKIPGMIAKRVYPIDAALNTISEGIVLHKEWKKGQLDGKDFAVSGSNIVIKTGAATAGALAGGALGGVFGGPAGAAVGAFIGGTAGAWVGDAAAGYAKVAIEDGPKAAVKKLGNDITDLSKKGYKWVKGIFK